MPSSLRSFCLTMVLVILPATRAGAQTEVTVLPGEPLRLEIVGPSTAPVGAHCSGRVMSAAQDTLVVATAGSCRQGSYLAKLQVIRGDRGSRVTHVGLGAFVGGLTGMIAARAMTKKDANTGEISRGKMWAGLGVGGLAGGAVGYVLPAGPMWVRAGSPRPLRVSGVDLRPGFEVAIAR